MKQITSEVKHFQIGGKGKQLIRVDNNSSRFTFKYTYL